jgi:hypothetical protein
MKRLALYSLLTVILIALLWNPILSVTYTYAVRELAQTFSALQTFSAGLRVTGGTVTIPGVAASDKIVHICASGCEYTTLNSACAAETSTAANPITYRVHAGSYAAADTMCSGEDHASFIGDGAATTILVGLDHGFGDVAGNDCGADVKACRGAINTGTSTNVEVSGFHLKGSRGLWMNGAGTGGGSVYVHDNIFESIYTNGDEDCFFWRGFVAGSEVRVENNTCTTDADGFTIDNDGTTRIFSRNNVFHTAATVQSAAASWTLRSIPCFFYSQGDAFYISGGKASSNGIMGYQFDGNPGNGSSGCAAGTAIGIIVGATANIANTTTNGNSGDAYFVRVATTAGELGRVDVIASDATVTTADATTGSAYAVTNALAGFTGLNVIGGRHRASGGAAGSTRDISSQGAGSPVNVLAVDYLTDSSATAAAPITMLQLAASTSTFGPGTWTYTNTTGNYPIVQSADGSSGLELDNTDEANAESSPTLILSNSTAGAGDDSFFLQVDSGASLNFDYPAVGANILRLRTGPDLMQSMLGRFQISVAAASMEIGDGSGADGTALTWNTSGTDLVCTWNDTSNSLDCAGMEVLRLGGTTTAPTLDTAGDIGIDTTANQFLAYSGGAVQTFDPVRQACAVVIDLTDSDDNFEFFMANQAITITSVGCHCRGTCTTKATFTLEDRAGNAMTITGTNPTCSETTGNATYAAVTAANGLVTGEGLRFDVTNTPNPLTDEYTLCVTYTIDRQ